MTLAEKKALVTAFLDRCNRYADREINRRRAALGHAAGNEALAIADEIAHWTAYRAFNEHAIGELATTRLDDWFD